MLKFTNPFAPKKPGENIDHMTKQIKKETSKRLAEKEHFQEKAINIGVILEECRFKFKQSILLASTQATEATLKGIQPVMQREIVREAAIGLLVVDRAEYELKSIRSENELSTAMNSLGMALRQLRRLGNTSSNISRSSERIIEQIFPGALNAEASGSYTDVIASMEVPAEIRSRVNEGFVDDLMNGDSPDWIIMKESILPRNDARHTHREDLLNAVRQSAKAEADDQNTDIFAKYQDHF